MQSTYINCSFNRYLNFEHIYSLSICNIFWKLVAYIISKIMYLDFVVDVFS